MSSFGDALEIDLSLTILTNFNAVSLSLQEVVKQMIAISLVSLYLYHCDYQDFERSLGYDWNQWLLLEIFDNSLKTRSIWTKFQYTSSGRPDTDRWHLLSDNSKSVFCSE